MRLELIFLIFNTLALSRAGISEEKCREYEEWSVKKVCTSLLPFPIGDGGCVKQPVCDSSTGLIVGGEEAKKHEFPHFALIGYRDNGQKKFKCGGSIISEYFVLTAAHCSKDENRNQASLVRVGEHNFNEDNEFRKEYDIDRFITKDYSSQNQVINDIALIKLTNPIKFNSFVRPACIHQNPGKILHESVVAVGMGALGFMEDSSSVLMKVNLTVVNPKKRCEYLGIDIRTQVCVAGSRAGDRNYGDTCQGDSGGPIQRRRSGNHCMFDLVGITSYGQACGFGEKEKGNGAVYTRIAFYKKWIEDTVWG